MIDHEILLEKLKKYGFNPMALKWFSCYLSNRMQCVDFDSNKSSLLSMSKGVPQGSILGPLLFLIFINDMHSCSSKFSYIMFADDTTLTNPLCTFSSDELDTEQSINIELNQVYKWLTVNKLSLNVTKSKFIIFHYPQRKLAARDIPNLQINGCYIERVHEFNFLGVILDETLNWNAHINKTSNIISKMNGIMNKLKRTLPCRILKLMYDSFILHHIGYGITAWGFNINRISKLQKRSVRIICNAKYNAHTDPLFKKMNIIQASDLFQLNCMKIYHNNVNNKVPEYIKNMFHIRLHGYNTRNRDRLPIQTNSSRSTKRLKIFIPQLLQSLPCLITDKIMTHSLCGFSRYFKRYKIDNYKTSCIEPYCYVCGRNARDN